MTERPIRDGDALIAAGYGHGTNRVCPAYVLSRDYCGCQRCGHLKSEHAPTEENRPA